MDILFVTLGPIDATFSMSFRNRAVLNGFVKLGHNVDVLTVYPYDDSIRVSSLDLSQYGTIIRLSKSGNSKKKISSPKKGSNNLLSRLIRMLYHRVMPFDSSFFLIRSLSVDLLPKKKYDTIISSSDPKTSHLAVRRLINTGLVYKNWIQYWGDPLTNDITTKLIYPKVVLKLLEKRLMKGADKIIYVSPITCKEQSRLFKVYSSKMRFLPIPYEKDKIYPPTQNTKFNVGYFGFYLKSVRNIVPLYNAVKDINHNIHLTIGGSTDLKLDECENISIYPNLNDVFRYESLSDLIVVVLNLRGGQIPGKLYHLSATNKPILVILDGDFKEVIKEYLQGFQRFIMCENDEVSISQAIIKQYLSKQEFVPSPLLTSSSIASQFLH
jgi:glycosyltransferase involved in cell wall biosynthesis